jgi:hypothetical protein
MDDPLRLRAFGSVDFPPSSWAEINLFTVNLKRYRESVALANSPIITDQNREWVLLPKCGIIAKMKKLAWPLHVSRDRWVLLPELTIFSKDDTLNQREYATHHAASE